MMCKLLILQLLAHLVSDFYLQTEKSCKSKADNAFKSGHLYIHALITFACAWMLSLNVGYWWAALLIAVLHLVMDGLKSICRHLKGAVFYEQLLHVAVIVAAVALFNNKGVISFPTWLPETKVLPASSQFLHSEHLQGGKNLHPRQRERTTFAQCRSCDWQCGKDAYACVCYVRAI